MVNCLATLLFCFIDLIIFFLCLLSAVFTWTNLLVVVVELDGNENEALDLIPLVTNTVSRFFFKNTICIMSEFWLRKIPSKFHHRLINRLVGGLVSPFLNFFSYFLKIQI